jgi:hypothetical protein
MLKNFGTIFRVVKLKPNLNKVNSMPILPIISFMLPALIQSAEQIFGGEKKGPEKKAFVMKALSDMIDNTPLPKYVDKVLLINMASVLVEHFVPTLLK